MLFVSRFEKSRNKALIGPVSLGWGGITSSMFLSVTIKANLLDEIKKLETYFAWQLKLS